MYKAMFRYEVHRYINYHFVLNESEMVSHAGIMFSQEGQPRLRTMIYCR